VNRVAIIGDGFIGAALAQRLLAEQGGARLCSLLSRSGRAEVPDACVVHDVPALLARAPDLVVEAAHPQVSRAWGERILKVADYMPLSLTALADDALRDRLLATASAAQRRLLIAHGAVVGIDSLLEWSEQWVSVRITFRKHPRNIDFAASGIEPPLVAGEVFRGSVREIACRFPRNVNAMVACALATTGLDACEAVLFADPALAHAELRIEAEGQDGSRLQILRRQPVSGVSGSEMAASAWRSIELAMRQCGPLAFV
jgi:aspartate dehydrogenase